MPLSSAEHRTTVRPRKERRNAAAKDRRAQYRGAELTRLRRENLQQSIQITRLTAQNAELQRRLDDALFTLAHCACGAAPTSN